MKDTLDSYIKKETAANIVVNALLGALIIWFLKKNGGPVILSGEEGYGADIIASSFLLPFLMSAAVIAIQRHRLKKGTLSPVDLNAGPYSHKILRRFPHALWLCALLFGLAGLLVFTPLTLLLAGLAGEPIFTPLVYTFAKAIWSGIVAGLMARPVILVALAEK